MSESHPSRRLIIGTRGSELALVQASATEKALAENFPGLEIVREIIRTTGDRRTDVALAEVAKAEGTFDKGVFIKELEEALDEGRIDIAVHSLKDMPTCLDGRFELAAVLRRAPVRDVLLTRDGGTLESLPSGCKVATSSVRRARQVLFLRPDLEVIDIRGNVPTRMRKLAAGNFCDAVLLAEAGLVRLGYLPESAIAEAPEPVNGMPEIRAVRLDESLFFPAAGQGAIGLEIRAADAQGRVFAESIGDADTWKRISAEREFLRLLDGGCHTPVGVYSTLDGDVIHLRARVFPEHDGMPTSGEARGTDPLSTALELFQSLS